jgi:tetratricopeptide (TPR) repeat protein
MPPAPPLRRGRLLLHLAVALPLLLAPPSAAAPQRDPRPRPPRAPTDEVPRGSGGGGSAAGPAGYRGALEVLAGGSTAGAAEALLASGLSSGVEPGSAAARVAERERMDLLAQLAGRDADALLPVAVLHLHLFNVHRARREYVAIAGHAVLVERAARLYAERSAGGSGAAVAADTLTLLGAALVSSGLRADARRILAAALALAPEQAEALLVLAADREREGAYAEAVELLRRLVAVRPEWLEPRVRLAVNLARTGAAEEAAERFAALCEDAAAGWAAVLSCQELARLRLAAGEPAAAVRILRAAVERFPDSERLRLALAYAVDRGGDPAAARSRVEELAARPAAEGETPRRRYNRGTDPDPLLALSARLQARAAAGTAALRTALETMAGEEDEEGESGEEA